VITLASARARTGYWREFINPGKNQAITPRGIFIPFQDILDMVALQKIIKTHRHHGCHKPIPIYVVGTRAYYSLQAPMTPPQPDNPPVEAVLVLVYQTNYREPCSEGEFNYNPDFPTYDLIVPVRSVKDGAVDGDADAASIYDITQPCPNLCDQSSQLY
jgi:hypothetical protein